MIIARWPILVKPCATWRCHACAMHANADHTLPNLRKGTLFIHPMIMVVWDLSPLPSPSPSLPV